MTKELDYRAIARAYKERPLRAVPYAQLIDLLSLPRAKAPSQYLLIRQLALDELLATHSVESLKERPLTVGAVLSMVGQSAFKATELKTRLTKLGIHYSGIVNESTTHVLLGRSPVTTKGLKKYGVTFMSDQALQASLDTLEEPYLQKDNKVAVDAAERLSDLLMSVEEDNVLLAIEIIKGGGFPSSLIPQAFWAMKTTRNKTVYRELKTILDKYLSPEGRKAIRKTFKISVRTPEDKLTKKLTVFCSRAPDLDALEVAKQLFHYYQKGMQYIWRCSGCKDLKIKVLEHFIEGEVLDLRDKGLSILPKQLVAYPQIKTALLQGNRFTTVPPVLSKLPHLKHLDLSNNSKMRQLSPRLLTMPSLRYLNLYGNFPYWNSQRLRKMNQLEKLVLRDWPHHYGANSPQAVRHALPNCELVLLP